MLKPHQERLVMEKQELDDKLIKLKAFCFSPGSAVFHGLPEEDRHLLENQYMAMKLYSETLSKRIARFTYAN